jgi:hypothetical protein
MWASVSTIRKKPGRRRLKGAGRGEDVMVRLRHGRLLVKRVDRTPGRQAISAGRNPPAAREGAR